MNTKNGSSFAALAAALLAGTAGAQPERNAPGDTSEGVSAEQGGPDGTPPEVIVMQPEERRVSELLETPVFDIEGTEIGEVDDLILSEDGTIQAVLAIGGIAGIGEKLVLIPLQELELTSEDDVEGRPSDSIGLRGQTGEQLADARPKFRYELK